MPEVDNNCNDNIDLTKSIVSISKQWNESAVKEEMSTLIKCNKSPSLLADNRASRFTSTHQNLKLVPMGQSSSSHHDQSEKGYIKMEHQSSPRSEEKSCCICFQRFEDASDAFRLHLLKHMEAYQGKSACPLCRVDCRHHEKMVDHFLIAHGRVNKLVCHYPTCVRSFRTSRTLELHAKRHRS